MTIMDRLLRLRGKMAAETVDVLLMTSSDDHASEYVGDYYKVTDFFSGCTSDNVVLIVTKEEARLWTDGRFFISAEAELSGSGILLMRMGEPGVPKVAEYLEETLSEDQTLAYDGRCVDAASGRIYREAAKKKGAKVNAGFDPAEGIWEDRPERAKHPVFFVPKELAGESYPEKLARVREAMEKAGAAVHILEKLDDICWLLNLRGRDITCNPVALSYLVICREEVHLFLQREEETDELRTFVSANAITLHPYEDFFTFLRQMALPGSVLVSEKAVSDRTLSILQERLRSEEGAFKLLDEPNPTELMKAVKNPTEIENIKKYYLLDSVALCKFLCWFDKTIGRKEITELSAAARLDGLRAEIPGFLELSFPTISAYGANAAMAHYAATAESFAVVEERGFYLVDSGGQYMGATTDVTRTIAAGPLTEEEKKAFTLVCAGNLNLQNARFLEGTGGVFLDAYARMPLWEQAMEYNHGTGHGIGYILNVHEGPQGIRSKSTKNSPDVPFAPGMIVSDEPGLYVEGKFGIRIETILLCVKDMENEFGKFLRFEPLTLAPIDRRALDPAYLASKDIERLNAYHEKVWESISPFLEGEELAWLYEATKEF
ncbi:MAG: aminopeptidase P family N-terminal domain-containing protein [Lachnospiraceae bacterium]